MKVKTRKDGEWFDIKTNDYVFCCDCGLAHEVKVRLSARTGKLQMSVKRDDAVTKAWRKKNKKRLWRAFPR